MIDEDGDIKPPSQFWELGVVAIAAVFTLSGVALCFFSFSPPHTSSAPQNVAAPQNAGEVTMGIGSASAIHPKVVQDLAPKPQ
jgi:hypothetical protein